MARCSLCLRGIVRVTLVRSIPHFERDGLAFALAGRCRQRPQRRHGAALTTEDLPGVESARSTARRAWSSRAASRRPARPPVDPPGRARALRRPRARRWRRLRRSRLRRLGRDGRDGGHRRRDGRQVARDERAHRIRRLRALANPVIDALLLDVDERGSWFAGCSGRGSRRTSCRARRANQRRRRGRTDASWSLPDGDE